MTYEIFLKSVANDLQTALIQNAPTSDGTLKSRIKVHIVGNELVVYMLDYALHVEYGTGGRLQGQTSTVGGKTVTVPAKPNRKMPVKKEGTGYKSLLEKWGKKKLGITDDAGQFALAKHIQMYGTRPFPFIRNTLYHKLPRIIEDNMNRHLGGGDAEVSYS